MGQEYELKYAANADRQAALLAQFGPWHTIAMETTYFDTRDRALSRARMTLRLRKENGLCICTVKTPLPGDLRGEWECPCDQIEAGVRQLIVLGAPAELAALASSGLEPVCGARFTRRAISLPTADGSAELALDSGVLLGGGKEIPLCEVELELKSGSEAAAAALAAQIAAQFGLTPEHQSKFRRALALAE